MSLQLDQNVVSIMKIYILNKWKSYILAIMQIFVQNFLDVGFAGLQYGWPHFRAVLVGIFEAQNLWIFCLK